MNTHERPPGGPEPADVPELVSDVLHRGARLLRNEFTLARREMAGKLSHAVWGIFMIVLAAFLVLSALDVLTAAAVAGLAEAGLQVSLASLLVAVVALVLAAVLFLVGRKRLTAERLTPEKSIKNVRRDLEALKENAHVPQ